MTPPRFHALTLASKGGLLRVLATDCHACAAFDPDAIPQGQRPQFHKFTAIWDTGATASVITQDVVTACGLKPTGMTQVHGVHGVQSAETFLINIGLPNGVAFANMAVTRGDIHGAQMLLGMDVITAGDFSITNLANRTVFSFRIPSQATVDFVKEANRPTFQHGSKQKHKKRPPKRFGRNK